MIPCSMHHCGEPENDQDLVDIWLLQLIQILRRVVQAMNLCESHESHLADIWLLQFDPESHESPKSCGFNATMVQYATPAEG